LEVGKGQYVIEGVSHRLPICRIRHRDVRRLTAGTPARSQRTH
jgi:hypothetical protein